MSFHLQVSKRFRCRAIGILLALPLSGIALQSSPVQAQAVPARSAKKTSEPLSAAQKPDVKSSPVKSNRSGIYQFVYDEKGASIRLKHYIELYRNGQWKMYRLPLESGLRAPQVPLRGTYKIAGQKITFQESKQSSMRHTGPGQPSTVDTGRFEGQDFIIVSLADHRVISQTVSRARYVKIRSFQ
ncbi:hypothetical protein EON80_16365 [bacterium]|nr:MAG: hypothetical protein EON80_16365 [bacterium]